MPLRPELQAIAERLLARHECLLALDTVADEIGAAAVTAQDIDAIFAALEAAGCTVGDPNALRASAHLGTVLASARELKRELGRTPSAADIAARSGLTPQEVRLALLFAQVAQR
ncbi:MAG TPA: sigma-70 domain-containing protein [Polyangiaceae bacterium]|nr:sigma-70 domain-containing protein [Polyangiaceae bacterium]